MRTQMTCLLAGVLLATSVIGCSRDAQVEKRRYLDSGNAYFAKQQYPEAIIEYRNALQWDARAGDVRLRLSQAYMQINDTVNAYREAVRAADLMPADVAAQVHATRFLLMVGQYEDAKSRAEKILQQHPETVEAQFLVGYATAGMKDFDAAIAQIEEAIGLVPDRSDSYSNLGVIHLIKGDRVRAEAAMKKALQIDPRSVAAHLALANFYWTVNRTDETERTLKAAVALDPADMRPNRALAALYQSTNRAAEAEPLLKQVAQGSPDLAPRLTLADYYLGVQRPADALKLLESLPADDASVAAIRSRVAVAQRGLGHTAEAYKTIDELLARDPRSVQAMVTRARFLLADSKPEEARVQAAAALAVDPDSVTAHFALGTASAMLGDRTVAIREFSEVLKLNPRSADAQVQLSRLHLEERRVGDSVEFAGQAVRNQPNSLDAHLMLTRGLLARGDLKTADARVRDLLNGAPMSPAVHALAGRLHLARKDVARAAASFNDALALDGQFVEAIAGLVTIDLIANRRADAVARLDERVAAAPGNRDLLLMAARTYLRINQLGKGEQTLRRLIEVDRAHFEAYEMLAQLYMSQQKLDQARAEYAELGARQPQSVLAHTMVATISHLQGDVDIAAATYQRVLAIDAHAPVAANNLAWLYAEGGGNLDVALELAHTAKRELPDQPEVNDTLGWIYYKKNLPQLAVVPLQESVARTPQNPLFHYHLGLAYAKLGDKLKARRALERALKLDEQFEGAAEARKVLATLEG